MAKPAKRRILVRLLGFRPLVAIFAHRLHIREIVDRHCPSRGNAHLSHGQVALAVIPNRLTTPRALYRLAPTRRGGFLWCLPLLQGAIAWTMRCPFARAPNGQGQCPTA